MITTIYRLIVSELKMNFRNLGSWLGVILFLLTSTYITFILFDDVQPATWLALIWMILLFSALQSFYSNFRRELIEKPLYHYTLYSAHEALISKLLYHYVLLLMLALITVGLLVLFHGFPISHGATFWLSLVVGTLGFSVLFTLTSGLSSRTDQSSSLLAVISLPLIIPFLLGVVNFSFKSIQMEASDVAGDVGLVIALIFISFGLSMFLFPLIWRD